MLFNLTLLPFAIAGFIWGGTIIVLIALSVLGLIIAAIYRLGQVISGN